MSEMITIKIPAWFFLVWLVLMAVNIYFRSKLIKRKKQLLRGENE